MSPDNWYLGDPEPRLEIIVNCFTQLALESTAKTIWRYMDFTKLVSMLDRRSLYFARADLLGDPFEGAYTRSDYEKFSGLRMSGREAFPFGTWEFTSCLDYRKELSKSARVHCYVNCWHMNPCESAAMWKLYLKSDEGIAVQSPRGRLEACLASDDSGAVVREVKYIDYDTDCIDTSEWINSLFYKRSSFAHENEVSISGHAPPSTQDS